MPRNASGVMQKPAGTTAIAFTTIESAKYNTLMDDFVSEITGSLPRNGTAAMLANLPFGGFRGVNIGAATALTDAIQSQQVLNNSVNAAADSGAVNAYVLTLSPPATTYTDFMSVWFTTSNANTGASTININSIGLADIVSSTGTSLSGGEISATSQNLIIYDGTNSRFVLFQGTGGGGACTTEEGTESNPVICLDSDGGGGGTGFFGTNTGTSDFIAVTVDGSESVRFAGGGATIVTDTGANIVVGGGTTTALGGALTIVGENGVNVGDFLYKVNDTEEFRFDHSQNRLEMSNNHIVDVGQEYDLGTYTVSNVDTQAHGLGQYPQSVSVWLECTTTDQGFAVGDRIDVTALQAGEQRTIITQVDTTNVRVITDALTVSVPTKTGGASAALTASSWKVILVVRG